MKYAPDSNERSPDILKVLANVLPTRTGEWRMPYAEESNGYNTIAAFTPYSAFFGKKPDGTGRLFVTNDTTIYEADAVPPGWTSRATLTSSTAGFHFCQVGQSTVAASLTNNLQYSNSGAFQTLTGNVKANAVASLFGALAAWNVVYNGTAIQDGLCISDPEDITNFVPDPTFATLAFQTTLNEVGGAGTAIIAFRNMLVIFKRRGMWIAQFTGDERIWDVQLYSSNVGCISKDSCAVIEDKLYFVDDNDFWTFDGAQLVSIAPLTRQLIFFDSPAWNATQIAYDDVTGLVKFYLCPNVGSPPSSAISGGSMIWNYCPATGEWGPEDGNGATYIAQLPVKCSKIDIRDFLGGFTPVNENKLLFAKSAAGATRFSNGLTTSATGIAQTARFGDYEKASSIDRVYLNAGTATGLVVDTTYRGPNAATQQSTATGTLDADVKADLMTNGNWHQLAFAFVTLTGWQGFQIYPKPAGNR